MNEQTIISLGGAAIIYTPGNGWICANLLLSLTYLQACFFELTFLSAKPPRWLIEHINRYIVDLTLE